MNTYKISVWFNCDSPEADFEFYRQTSMENAFCEAKKNFPACVKITVSLEVF